MTEARQIEGGCLCGGVRYRLAADGLRDLVDCHCVDCRRASGAPFVTWGTTDAAGITIKGELRRVPHAGRVRSFAACCGTPLFFQQEPEAPTVDLAIATLDDPRPYPPVKSIWTEDRLPWVPLDPGRPVFVRSSAAGG